MPTNPWQALGFDSPDSSPAPSAPVNAAEPLGVRNNNPGNLGKGTKFNGEIGDSGRFGVYDSAENGLRAISKNLLNYNAQGVNTPAAIISKWAPPNENKTDAYITDVSRALGVNPDTPLDLTDPQTLAKLTVAIVKKENGKQPYSPEQISGAVASALSNAPAPAPVDQPPAAQAPTTPRARSPFAELGFDTPDTAPDTPDATQGASDEVPDYAAQMREYQSHGAGKHFLGSYSDTISGLPALGMAAVGLLGKSLERVVGTGGAASWLADTGLSYYQAHQAEEQKHTQFNSDITTALHNVREKGDYQSLLDLGGDAVGMALGMMTEQAAATFLGGLVGSAVGPEGTVGGAVSGAVAPTAIKGLVRSMADKAIAEKVSEWAAEKSAKMIASGIPDALAKREVSAWMANDAVRSAAVKAVGKDLGQTAASNLLNVGQTLGMAYGGAAEQAEKDGRELDGVDLLRVWGLGTVAGKMHEIMAATGVNAVAGKIPMPGATTLGRTATGAVAGTATGAASMVGMTAALRGAAGKDITSDEAQREYANAAVMGGLPGAGVGAIGGAVAGPRPATSAREVFDRVMSAPDIDTAISEALDSSQHPAATQPEVSADQHLGMLDQGIDAYKAPLQEAEVSADQRIADASANSVLGPLPSNPLTGSALRSIEQRGGVASPEEAAHLDTAMPGQRPYDSIDPNLAIPPRPDTQPKPMSGVGSRVADIKADIAEGTSPYAQKFLQDYRDQNGIGYLDGKMSDQEILNHAGKYETDNAKTPDQSPPLSPEVQGKHAMVPTEINPTVRLERANQIAEKNKTVDPIEAAARARQEEVAQAQKEAQDRLAEAAPPTSPGGIALRSTDRSDAAEGKSEEKPLSEESDERHPDTIEKVSPESLPKMGGPGESGMTQRGHRLVSAVARIFNKQVVLYRAPNGGREGGFVHPSAPGKIFLNVNARESHLAVVGHELTHLMAKESPKAFSALRAVIEKNLSEEDLAKFKKYYKLDAEDHIDELTNDLVGNHFMKPEFWHKVFTEISREHSGEARQIIAHLGRLLRDTIDRVLKVVGGKGFDSEKFVKNLREVSDAVHDAMVQYAKETRDPTVLSLEKPDLALTPFEQHKARNEKGAIMSPDRGGVSVTGTHYSTAKRTEIDTSKYGTGERDAAAGRIASSGDARLKKRAYFYVNEGKGVKPESGVGYHAHEAKLDNLYDTDADHLGLTGKGGNALEQGVLDNGYSGYYAPKAFGAHGAAVMLGDHKIPVEYKGMGGRPPREDISRAAPTPKVKPEHVQMSPDRGEPVVNIGLDVPGGGGLDAQHARDALAKFGVKIKAERIQRSNTEQTLVATLDKPLSDADMHQLSVDLKQEAIPQWDGKKGALHGPEKQKWDNGRFNPDYFIEPNGKTMSENDAAPTKAPSREQASENLGRDFKDMAKEIGDEAFQYPRLKGDKDLQKTANQTGLPIKVTEEENPINDQAWIMRMPDGKPVYVERKGKDVFADLASLESGKSRGTAAYQTISSWAHANGYIFEGDPKGISGAGMSRRTENMISSAIRHDSTDHLRLHPDQKADQDINWGVERTNHNLGEMLRASYNKTVKEVPEIADITATEHGDFVNGKGELFTDPDFAKLAGRDASRSGAGEVASGKAEDGRAGVSTLKRAAVVGTLLRRASSGDGAELRPRGESLTRALYSPEREVEETPKRHDVRDENGRFAPTGKAQLSADRQVFGDLNPAQEAAMRAVVGLKQDLTMKESIDKFKANLGLRIKQGLVDQFAAIKEVSQKGYMLARMSKGTDGTLEATLLYGAPEMNGDLPDVKIGKGGFVDALTPLQGEHQRALLWIAAKRAEQLKAQGKENLFTDTDITALKTLDQGNFADGTSRKQVYSEFESKLNDYNKAVLKIALDSGLIDQAAYDMYRDQPYVPFYRIADDDGLQGPKFSSGLMNQYAWKKLKGGTDQLNSDLLSNVLMNWGHMFDAAAKNRAARETMDAAENLGVAYKLPSAAKGSVAILRDGAREHFQVMDPHLLEAISAINYVNPEWAKPFSTFKHLLTFGATATPVFKIRNLIRDTLTTVGISDVDKNIVKNLAQGWKATAHDSQTRASMLASGGIIRFGAGRDGMTRYAEDMIEKTGGKLLDRKGWKEITGQVRELYDAYAELGDRSENINRAALYEQLLARGKTHAEASYMSRDLLDFTMSGRWPLVRFLVQSVPFLNARIQGLYKMGKFASENPQQAARFAAVAGAVSMASWGLMMAYKDDKDWKQRPDWDRDTYWWFKVGDTAIHIPKPFELGTIGTMAERSWEYAFDKEMTSSRFASRVSAAMFQTFSMDPTPQIVKPILDIYANKDSFTGRSIESTRDQQERPQDRYDEHTSMIARALGQMGLPNPAALAKGQYEGLSPKQIDFMIKGYLGSVGAMSVTALDYGLRPLSGQGSRPDMRLKDVFLAGDFVSTVPEQNSRYVDQFYQSAQKITQAYQSYHAAVTRGDVASARQIASESGDLIKAQPEEAKVAKELSAVNTMIRNVDSSMSLSGETKRAVLDKLYQQRNGIAERAKSLSTM